MINNNKGRYLIILLATVSIFAGCTSVRQDLMLQQVNVFGPVYQPPQQITGHIQPGHISISPKVSFFTKSQLEARVDPPDSWTSDFRGMDTLFDSHGNYYVTGFGRNSSTGGKRNLKWDLPDLYAGFDMTLPFSKTLAFEGGFSYAVKNTKSVYGGSLGLGLISEKERYATRLSMGVIFQQYFYDASTVVITSESKSLQTTVKDISYFHDIGKNTNVNFYAAFSYNTISENSPVDFFVGFSYLSQTLIDFKPAVSESPYGIDNLFRQTVDARGEASAGFLGIAPGIYLNFSQTERVIFGASILQEVGGLSNLSESLFIVPTFRIEFML